MGFLEFLFKGGELPAQQQLTASYIDSVPVESPWADSSHLDQFTLQSLYGLTPDRLIINRSTAMSVAAIAKGRNLICSSIARMPLVAMRSGQAINTQPTLLTQLQEGVPNFITLTWVIDSLIFHGRAFLLITARDATGKPSSLRWVPEADAETKNGVLVRAFDQDVNPGSSIRIDSGSEGFLTYGADVIRECKEIEQAAREAGANPVPSVVLAQKDGTELSEDEISSLLAGWRAARSKRGGSVGFTSPEIEAKQLGQHAENLLISGRNQAVLQVARALGLPAFELLANVEGTSLSYNNQADRNRQILDALTSYIVTIEQTLSLYLPAGQYVKFDTSELLKPDTAERYDYYKTAADAGFLTVNEIRERESLPPLTNEQRALNTPVALPEPEQTSPSNEDSE